MRRAMGTCLAFISPKLAGDDAKQNDTKHGDISKHGSRGSSIKHEVPQSLWPEANSTDILHRHNMSMGATDVYHLHRDSLGGDTIIEQPVHIMTSITAPNDREHLEDIMQDSVLNVISLQELVESSQSVLSASSFSDEEISDTSCDDPSKESGTASARPSKTKALLKEFETIDRRKAKNNMTATVDMSRTKSSDKTQNAGAMKNSTYCNGVNVCPLAKMRLPNGTEISNLISDFPVEKPKHRHSGKLSHETKNNGSREQLKKTSRPSSTPKAISAESGEQENKELMDIRALHNAAQKGDAKLVTRLLQSGAKVNARDAMKRTALHEVADMGHVSIGRLLLEHGAKVNAHDKWKCTPLHHAVIWKRAKMVNLLLEHNARATEGTLLQDVISMDLQDDVIIKLIARGADVNATDITGQTPMHIAVKYGRADIMWLLFKAGANVNKVSQGLVEENHGAVIKNARRQLIPLGLEGLLQDGWSPLRMAQKYKHFDLVVWLLKCGANIVLCDPIGRFPHHKATIQRNCPSLHHIVANEYCPIDICDINGNNAITLNFEAHAKYMVDSNPRCGCCSNESSAKTMIACVEYANTTLLLLQHGADITDLYIHGYDLLHHLCSSKFVYNLRLLQGVLNSGNDLVCQLSSAQSCLNALKRQLRLDMYEYLDYFVNSPRNLQDQCRLMIRSTLRHMRPGRSIWTAITALPLPHSLMDFLLLQSLQGATLTRHFTMGHDVIPRQANSTLALSEMFRNPVQSLC